MMRRKLHALISLTFLVLCFASTLASAATKKPPLKPINLNTANSEELQQVPGIGPATADKILQMRKSYGAFKSVDDLLAIKGIGKKRLEKMRKYLTTGKPAVSNKSTACPGCPRPVSQAKAPPPKLDPIPVPEPAEPPQP